MMRPYSTHSNPTAALCSLLVILATFCPQSCPLPIAPPRAPSPQDLHLIEPRAAYSVVPVDGGSGSSSGSGGGSGGSGGNSGGGNVPAAASAAGTAPAAAPQGNQPAPVVTTIIQSLKETQTQIDTQIQFQTQNQVQTITAAAPPAPAAVTAAPKVQTVVSSIVDHDRVKEDPVTVTNSLVETAATPSAPAPAAPQTKVVSVYLSESISSLAAPFADFTASNPILSRPSPSLRSISGLGMQSSTADLSRPSSLEKSDSSSAIVPTTDADAEKKAFAWDSEQPSSNDSSDEAATDPTSTSTTVWWTPSTSLSTPASTTATHIIWWTPSSSPLTTPTPKPSYTDPSAPELLASELSTTTTSSKSYDDGMWHTYYPAWNATSASVAAYRIPTTSLDPVITPTAAWWQ